MHTLLYLVWMCIAKKRRHSCLVFHLDLMHAVSKLWVTRPEYSAGRAWQTRRVPILIQLQRALPLWPFNELQSSEVWCRSTIVLMGDTYLLGKTINTYSLLLSNCSAGYHSTRAPTPHGWSMATNRAVCFCICWNYQCDMIPTRCWPCSRGFVKQEPPLFTIRPFVLGRLCLLILSYL